jgi:hypothetical protein
VGSSSCFIDLITRWRRVVRITSRPHFAKKISHDRHWVDQKVGLDCVKLRNNFLPWRESKPRPPAGSTSLYQLSYFLDLFIFMFVLPSGNISESSFWGRDFAFRGQFTHRKIPNKINICYNDQCVFCGFHGFS